jgi:hypothetical protein
MSILDRLFAKRSTAPAAAAQIKLASPSSVATKDTLSMILLFDALPPVRQSEIESGLLASGGLRRVVSVSDDFSEGGNVHAIIGFDEHRMRLWGFELPAPQNAIDRAIDCAQWPPADKQALRNHRAHLVVLYLGGDPDPTEQLLALLRLAGTFVGSGLLGVVDASAWNCIPAQALGEITKPEMLSACKQALPIGICTGFAKIFKSPEEVWFCSKGLHRWGVVDFAFFGKPSEAQEIAQMFSGLFDYARRSRAVLKVGNTAEFGAVQLRFEAVTEYPEFLEGPLGTLVVVRLAR